MSQVLLMTVARSGVVDALASLCIEQLLLTLSNDLQGGVCRHWTWCRPLAGSFCSLPAVTKLLIGTQQYKKWWLAHESTMRLLDQRVMAALEPDSAGVLLSLLLLS